MKLQTITNIETSAKCNLSCQYCMSPIQMKWRDVGLMSMHTFEATMDIVKKLVKKGTQREINLFGVGEPLLNEHIIDMLKMAKRISPIWPVHLNTNGIFFTEEIAKKLKDAGLDGIDITGHNHKATATSIKICKKMQLKYNVTYDFAIAPNNWAGQVDWFEPDYTYPCPWVARGQAFVMWDGAIVNCCFDAKKMNVLGNVYDTPIDAINIKPFELCGKCHQKI